MVAASNGKRTALSEVSNDAKQDIELSAPYVATVELEGSCPIIFHRWSCDSVEEKANAKKGSRAKKTDDLESYVWHDESGLICIPGVYLQRTIINAAKYRQDPRSPRKSMMDLAKAAIFPLEELSPILSASGKTAKDWDFVDRRHMTVQRSGITRCRPAFHAGWKATFHLQCLLREYIDPQTLNDMIQVGGKIIGLADSRPTFGRYLVTSFKVSEV